jgi:hypothetical protein
MSKLPGGWLPSAIELPFGYPAYCIYLPTGMNKPSEVQVLAKLKDWGTTMGNNLLVAPWDIGDKSYIRLAQRTGITRLPSIVLTDDNTPYRGSFLIVIDEPTVVNDVDVLTEILPDIVNYILIGDTNAAMKHVLREREHSRVKPLLKPFASTLRNVKKLKFSFAGFGVDVEF